MDKISKLTRGVMAGKGLDRAAEAAFICHIAGKVIKEIFDKSFLKEIKIISFRDRALFISTSNSTYSQEIKMKEREILRAVNGCLEKDLVEKIRFKPTKKESL